MSGPTYSITAIAPTVSASLGLPRPRDCVEGPIPAIAEDLAGVRQVAVLAPDALGLSVWQTWRRQMPFLSSVLGSRSVTLRSVLPPITPVNFASLVTGATPDIHRVRDKSDTIACESLFDVVRAAGGRSAGAGQPRYTGGEFLARHADLSGRPEESGDDAVTARVIALAQEHRPRFIIAQLGETDTVFHEVGPSSPKAEAVIRATDGRLRRLVEGLTGLDYGVIILADHGQHDLPEATPGGLRGHHDGSKPEEDCLVPCTWCRQ